jgi:hypothetical protein
LKTKYLVTIICFKGDKSYLFEDTCEDMVAVSRLLIAYQPKRGYEVIQYTVDVVEVLDVLN